jgi:hypothetical protein
MRCRRHLRSSFVHFIELHDNTVRVDTPGDVRARHEAFVGPDRHGVTLAIDQLDARHPRHETDDPEKDLTGIFERACDLLDAATDFAIALEPI